LTFNHLRYVGSPPRLRGAQSQYALKRISHRITPAPAGSTPFVWGTWGEFSGSPPRLRGAHSGFATIIFNASDHPRACGEHTKKSPIKSGFLLPLLLQFNEFFIKLLGSQAVIHAAMLALHFYFKMIDKCCQFVIVYVIYQTSSKRQSVHALAAK
jgi:hypothetical protein